jgi:hypothetical protein
LDKKIYVLWDKKFNTSDLPCGHFADAKCLQAGPRGFCLSALRASNKNIAPGFKSWTQAKQFACLGGNLKTRT